MRFIEVMQETVDGSRHVNIENLISIDEIVRVVRCNDDYYRSNIVTRDGHIYHLAERYEDVRAKILACEKGGATE